MKVKLVAIFSLYFWLLVVLATNISGCATGSLGKTLGVDVIASGDSVEITWDKRHTWNQTLSTKGAELVAEYKTENRGLVREILGKSNKKNERTIWFDLPPDIKAVPLDHICLYIQPIGHKLLLPIRRSKKSVKDTARFRYPAWEAIIKKKSSNKVHRSEIHALQAQIMGVKKKIESRQNRLTLRGAETIAMCAGLNVKSTETSPGYDVVPIDEQDGVARQICAHQLWVSRKIAKTVVIPSIIRTSNNKSKKGLEVLSRFPFLMPQMVGYMLQNGAASNANNRRQVLEQHREQAQVFVADWRKYSNSIGENYKPQLGKPDDYMSFNESMRETAMKYYEKHLKTNSLSELSVPNSDEEDVLIRLASSSLETYFACVNDNNQQLAIKWDAWDKKRRTSPYFDQEKRRIIVSECKREHGKISWLKSEEFKLQAELQGVKANLVSVSGIEESQSKSRPLNFNICY